MDRAPSLSCFLPWTWPLLGFWSNFDTHNCRSSSCSCADHVFSPRNITPSLRQRPYATTGRHGNYIKKVEFIRAMAAILPEAQENQLSTLKLVQKTHPAWHTSLSFLAQKNSFFSGVGVLKATKHVRARACTCVCSTESSTSSADESSAVRIAPSWNARESENDVWCVPLLGQVRPKPRGGIATTKCARISSSFIPSVGAAVVGLLLLHVALGV